MIQMMIDFDQCKTDIQSGSVCCQKDNLRITPVKTLANPMAM